MKIILLKEHFDGDFLADGRLANKFRFSEIEPLFAMQDKVVFDFSGINNITDSFANGLIGNLAELHSDSFMGKVRFRNCTPAVRSAIEFSISLGLSRTSIRG